MIYNILVAYIVLLLFLIIIYSLLSKHLKKIFKQINYLIDFSYFQIAIFLEKNKQNIIKYNNLIEYLFYPKKKFINGFHSDIIDFNNFWNELEKHIEETEKILNQNILNTNILVEINNMFNIGIKLFKIKKFLKKILCILTLGIFCFLN